jgi:hypothetical protein
MLHNIRLQSRGHFFCSLLTSTMTDESATRREANRLAVQKYYRANASKIICNKTLRLATERGRVPRRSTVESHDIDRHVLQEALLRFAESHPESRAARKIARLVDD